MKTEAETKISALKDALKTDNVDDIKAKTKELSETMQKIGAELNKAGSQTPPTGEQKAEEKKEEPKADEGEFKEKK